MDSKLINTQGKTYQVAEKPYYGRFPFRVIIEGVRRNWRMSTQDQRAYDRFYADSRRMLAWAQDKVKSDWRVRRESNWSFFFVEQADCQAFVNEFYQSVCSIAGPKNQYHQERMLESPKLLVRRSLFKKRFPHRASIAVNNLTEQAEENFRAWLSEHADSDDVELNYNLMSWYSQREQTRWSTKTIYFIDESYSLVLKLMLGDNLGKIEKVITVDEFSQQEATNQENA